MKRRARLLPIAGAVSVVIALCLACGHFVPFGYVIRVSQPLAPNEYYRYREYRVFVAFGHVEFQTVTVSYPRRVTIILTSDGSWVGRPHLPVLRYIWEIRAVRQKTRQGVTGWSFSFPIWCPLLPCLIAPVIWLRKRRRSQPIGFDVIAQSK